MSWLTKLHGRKTPPGLEVRILKMLPRITVLGTLTILAMPVIVRFWPEQPGVDAAKHIKQSRTIVKKLRTMGVGFALEHYGIDQERFQILDILKPDYIKVDGELMHTLMTDSNMQGSVEKIVAAAKERNIKSIAERVENANAMAVLFQLGLDYMQGHYVHEPEVVLQDAPTSKQTSLADLAAANSN